MVGQRNQEANEAYFKGIRAFHSDSGDGFVEARTIPAGHRTRPNVRPRLRTPCNLAYCGCIRLLGENLEQSRTLAEKAISLDRRLAVAHMALCWTKGTLGTRLGEGGKRSGRGAKAGREFAGRTIRLRHFSCR